MRVYRVPYHVVYHAINYHFSVCVEICRGVVDRVVILVKYRR